jgi:DNA-binding HxlR family transcriptional regulator
VFSKAFQITALGGSLLPVVQALKTRAETDIEAVHAARDAYDARAAAAP